jgi:hypothetical protein
MPSLSEVEQILLRAGERRASARVDGFHAKALGGGVVVVRWRARSGSDGAAAGVAFIEEYAPLLRDAGLNATVKADGHGVRVVCSPSPAPGWSAPRRKEFRAVS